MIAKATIKHLRISPTKAREVIDLIRGKGVRAAEDILLNIPKRPKTSIYKILKSAISNALQKGFKAEQLYISKIVADVGPVWKRHKAAAFGRAVKIRKRTTHITVELDIK